MSRLTREDRQQLAETHRQSIRANIEHRLATAKARGDWKLVELLEAEAAKC
jgi:hypothetical protein